MKEMRFWTAVKARMGYSFLITRLMQKGNVLIFKSREVTEGENLSQKEKAVSGAVNS
jgi:hypothetical protein